jgi:HEAT repeat protein
MEARVSEQRAGQNVEFLVLGIITGLGDHRDEVRQQAASHVTKVENEPGVLATVLRALEDPRDEVRLGAFRFLAGASRPLVREAGPALVPHIINMLQIRDPDGLAEAWSDVDSLITRIADMPGVLSGVMQALEDGGEATRLAALEILTHMVITSRSAREAVPSVIKATRDNSRQVRQKAFLLLGRVGPEQGVIPALIAGLQETHTRIDAAFALSSYQFKPESFGPEAELAIPPLITMLKDKNSYVGGYAVEALVFIGPHARKAIPALMKELKQSGNIRIIEAIKNMGPFPEVVEALIKTFRVLKQSPIYHPAGTALAEIGPQPVVLQRLVRALHDKNHRVRAGAADALAQMGPRAKEAVPVLIELLRNEVYVDVIKGALRALGNMGPHAEAAVPLLLELASGDDHVLGYRSQSGFKKIKRAALRRLQFFKEENRRPWSFGTLDDPSRASRALTRKFMRQDAVFAIIRASSDMTAILSAVDTLKTLQKAPGFSVTAENLRSHIGSVKFEQIKQVINLE